MSDLVVLVPDKNIEQAIGGLLNRHQSIGIKQVEFQIIVHPQRDPGVYQTGYALLEPFEPTTSFALVVFDFAWDGRPTDDPAEMARHVQTDCQRIWQDRAKCICITPEIENWIWSDSPHVAKELGWERTLELKAWLEEKGFWPADLVKPIDPKAAFLQATKHKRIVPSSAIFRSLADKVSLRRCVDESFGLLVSTLQQWFPVETKTATL